MNPNTARVYYNLFCYKVLKDESSKVFNKDHLDYIEEAIELECGYWKFAPMDKDLESIKNNNDFTEFLKKMKPEDCAYILDDSEK